MERDVKYFSDPENGGMDADSAPFAVSPNSIVNSENVRWGTTDAGVTNVIESIGSTVLKSTPQPSITFLTIGAAEDTENRRFCQFKFCTTGPWHRIVCYYEQSEIEYTVLLSSQVTGGLNFDKNSLIHSARIVNGILYWCEGTENQPRRINIEAGINLNQPGTFPDVTAYVTPIEQTDIYWIRSQPGLPLEAVKDTDADYDNNFIEDDAFMADYRFISREYETSTLSPFSLTSNYNSPGDTFNRIIIKVPFAQKITQDVLQIDLCIKYLATNKIFAVKSWNKNVPADLLEIENHNSGITQLTFNFYNDFIGIALDDAYSVKPYDSLPIYAQTIEFARNRAFMANYVIGYDTPQSSSSNSLIAVPFVETTTGAVLGRWLKLVYAGGASVKYFIDISTMTSGNGIFEPDVQPASPPPFPATIDYTLNLTYVAAGPGDFVTYAMATYPGFVTVQIQPYYSTITSAPFPPPGLTGGRCFKTQSNYKLAITLYDFAGRKCGVILNGSIVNIGDRAYDQINYTTRIDWALDNVNVLAEVPEWAFYYSIDMTKCLRTRYFLQVRGIGASYVTKDVDGVYVFTTTAYVATALGCAFNVSLLGSASMGYLFDPAVGDIIKIYPSTGGGIFMLKITGQSGNFLITELQDIGVTLDTGTKFLFEIYTPYRPSVSEAYYEQAQVFQITNPGTSARAYSTLSGSILGDVTLLTRNDGLDDYLTENMSPNDKYYSNWNTDSGRPNFIDTIGQVEKKNSIAYSNTLLQGTRSNGLATFDALDVKDIPIECGPVRKLETTSKVQNEIGVVMLSISEVETASLYIGEQQLQSTIGNAFIAASPDVIGTINILKGSFGTTNPESVVEYRGNVFWFNAYTGRVIQYSANGLFAISNYKMTRFWNLFAKQYLSMTAEEIEALGGRPFVFSAVDPHHNELLFSIPKLLDYPPKGYLPDYPSTIYPFDVYDGQGKTVVYKLDVGAGYAPHWQGTYAFNPEYFITLIDNLYSFKNGNNYLHNSETSFCNFYGIQYTPKIMFVSNGKPTVPKIYDSISVQSNIAPNFIYFYNSYPVQQSSDLRDIDFKSLEGVWYAPIYRNKLIPTAIGFVATGLLTGEKMRNTAMMVMIEFDVTSECLNMIFVEINYSVSRGHRGWNIK